jgi:asparagine synthase (glutamine-hydrolysing)
MCGIAGIVGFVGQTVRREMLVDMVNLVAHRGPDGEGTLLEGAVGLGHRRLAIVDLSPDGHQPMTDRRGEYTVVFNGEIYNHVELRHELEQIGHVFASRSDTEVLLAAYAEWGEACVSRFNGMWSFAILDRRRNRLFCSRDRFGEKPFYYIRTGEWFAFGSEIRQLLPFLDKRQAHRETLLQFLMGSVAEPPEQTFFVGVHKLPAGHNLVLDLSTHEFSIARYYELRSDASVGALSLSGATELFSELLDDAVRIRLRADVPVGTCLSGGLDSSSVATLAARQYHAASGGRFAAITAASELLVNDETGYARQVVQHNQLRWYVVRPEYPDFVASLDDVMLAQEEPFPSPSIVMQYFVMQAAKQKNLTVLLDGQGGDETLLGYERYFAAHYLAEARAKGWGKTLLDVLRNSRNNTLMAPWRVIAYFVYFNSARVRWSVYRRRHPYLRELPNMLPGLREYAATSGSIFGLQQLEIEKTNLPALLRYEDKNSMRHAVETRLPFLDYRLVELALSLPGDSKISDGWTKYVLRKAMSGRMPDSIVWRRNKMGFEAPASKWFAMHGTVMRNAVMGSRLLRELSYPGAIERHYESLDALTRWRLFIVSKWEQLFNVGVG